MLEYNLLHIVTLHTYICNVRRAATVGGDSPPRNGSATTNYSVYYNMCIAASFQPRRYPVPIFACDGAHCERQVQPHCFTLGARSQGGEPHGAPRTYRYGVLKRMQICLFARLPSLASFFVVVLVLCPMCSCCCISLSTLCNALVNLYDTLCSAPSRPHPETPQAQWTSCGECFYGMWMLAEALTHLLSVVIHRRCVHRETVLCCCIFLRMQTRHYLSLKNIAASPFSTHSWWTRWCTMSTSPTSLHLGLILETRLSAGHTRELCAYSLGATGMGTLRISLLL